MKNNQLRFLLAFVTVSLVFVFTFIAAATEYLEISNYQNCMMTMVKRERLSSIIMVKNNCNVKVKITNVNIFWSKNLKDSTERITDLNKIIEKNSNWLPLITVHSKSIFSKWDFRYYLTWESIKNTNDPDQELMFLCGHWANSPGVVEKVCPVSEPLSNQEEYKVYSDFFKEYFTTEFIGELDQKFTLVIDENVGMSDMFHGEADLNNYITSFEKETNIKLDFDLVSSFMDKNGGSYILSADRLPQENFSQYFSIVTFGASDFNKIFDDFENGWKKFYEIHPTAPGIISVSRVGFDQKATTAIFSFGMQSDYLAGAGFDIVMKKINGQWKIIIKRPTWIS